MRYRIVIAYDGSKFYGFQRQKDKITVQGKLENALSIINKKECQVKGASRTDIGVHALGQVAHFDLDYEIPPERLKKAINSIVHPYIDVLNCEVINSDFHSRFKAKGKEYVYKIWLGKYDPLKYNYYLIYGYNLNLNKLRECASLFIGKQNFHNFVSGERKNYNSEIFSIDIEQQENEILIRFKGKSFYRYMIRNIVGAMLDYNENKCSLEKIQKMLEDENLKEQLSTALANGLYLEKVIY